MNRKNAPEKSTFKIAFFINKGNIRKKTGKAPIVTRITINGDQAHFNTKLDVLPHYWDVETGTAKKPKKISKNQSVMETTELNSINSALDQIKAKLYNDYYLVLNQERVVTSESLKNCFLGLDKRSESLLSLFDEVLKEREELIPTGELSYSTFKKYRKTRERLAEFIPLKYNVSDITIQNVSFMFWENFIHYLRTACKLSTNVLAKDAQLFKQVITRAHQQGIISVHPFPNATVKKEKKERICLTMSEVNRIISHDFSDCERLEHIRDIFIFSCFTGLAYIDIANLKEKTFSEHSAIWLNSQRIKTGVTAKIPLLCDIPRLILDKYKGKLKNGKLLPVPSNQKVNNYLKEIQTICKIEKNLTFHMARHSFATTVTLGNQQILNIIFVPIIKVYT